MRKVQLLLLLLAVAVMPFVSACGGGGDGTPASNTTPVTPAPQVLTGVFLDGPVEGVAFVSGAQTGTTDASGAFKFEAGGTVQFKVGNVTLGTAPGKSLLTPVDLVKAVDPAATVADARVIQITQFLMTCNANPAASVTMSIPAATATAAAGEAAVNLSQAPVDVAAILGRVVPTKTMVTAAAAAAHIQATLGALGAAKAGTFAAVDSTASPTLGIIVNVASNAIGNGFDVTGTAVSTAGATWDLAGTMTTNGAFQATGTGTGTAPPASLTLTGSMASATQIAATAGFTLNGAAKSVPLTFEIAVAPAAAAVGKFGLPTDPGVPLVAGDIVHLAADLSVKADGTVSAHIVRGQITGIVALAAIYSSHVTGLTGVITGANNIIAIGGSAGEQLNLNGKTLTNVPPVAIFTGSVDPVAATAAIKMMAMDLNLAGPAATTLNFAKTANPFVGAYQGTHSDTAPGLPSTFTFGVNIDNAAHGFAMFLRQRPADIQKTPFLLDGVVNPATGALAPPVGFNIGGLGTVATFPGLVMTDSEGVTTLTPGTFAGTITSATGATSGTWQTGPGVLVTGTFAGNLMP